MNPPLSPSELSQIIAEHHLSLSEEYQTILTSLGNGGAGCGYGLTRLNLNYITPTYPGSDFLLRNWNATSPADDCMVDVDEISGYVPIFNYGCGIELALIVNGPEAGSLIQFDCDGRFEKMKTTSLLDFFDQWLDSNISTFARLEKRLREHPYEEVFALEWAEKNFFVRAHINSFLDVNPPDRHNTPAYNDFLNEAIEHWRKKAS